ncbi:MAG: hypothetical protein LUD68_04285 [Rikenellaceae bacterium]|nr:hypothetical protein [Rikenellaceae bacterium]
MIKYSNIIGTAAVLCVILTGCSDRDGESLNTVRVSVGFEQSVVSLKETVEFVTLPIVIEEEVPRDGDIIL